MQACAEGLVGHGAPVQHVSGFLSVTTPSFRKYKNLQHSPLQHSLKQKANLQPSDCQQSSNNPYRMRFVRRPVPQWSMLTRMSFQDSFKDTGQNNSSKVWRHTMLLLPSEPSTSRLASADAVGLQTNSHAGPSQLPCELCDGNN